jgi:hypothetical protein
VEIASSQSQIAKPGIRMRWIAGGAFVTAIVVVLVVSFWSEKKEPEYKGTKLSEWLMNYSRNPTGATEAVRAMRKEAVPWLVNWVEAYELTKKRAGTARKFPRWVQENSVVRRWVGGRGGVKVREFAAKAHIGLRILGPDASSAIPTLSKIVLKSSSQDLAAAQSLAYLGQEGLQPLMVILADGTRPRSLRMTAARALGNMGYLGSNAVPAVPILIKCLEDKDDFVSMTTAQALLSLLGDLSPIGFVDQVDWSIERPGPDVTLRRSVVSGIAALEKIPERGRMVLTNALGDPNRTVRHEARTALDRMAATNIVDPAPQ